MLYTGIATPAFFNHKKELWYRSYLAFSFKFFNMKRLFLIFLLLFNLSVFADGEFENIDFNFIDTAFDGIKPITNKQFNDTFA